MPEFTLADRAGKLGASDWTNVFGIEPYGCMRKGCYEKRGEKADYPVDETDAMERGHALEPIVAAKYTRETGNKVIKRTSFGKQENIPDYWMMHVDRVIPGDNDGRGTGILECKTAMREVFHRIIRNGKMHDSWMLQVQHYLAMSGYKWADACVLWPDGFKHRIFHVERDDELIAKMIRYSDNFWRMVENGPLPDRLPVDSRQCAKCPWRRTCQAELLDSLGEKKGVVSDYIEVNDANLTDLIKQYQDVGDVVKDATDERNALNAQIKELLAGMKQERVMVSGAKVCMSTSKPRVTLDMPGFKATKPLLYDRLFKRFPKVGKPSTTLRIYPA